MKSSSLSGGEIAGIAIGVILLLVIFVCYICFRLWRKKRGHSQESCRENGHNLGRDNIIPEPTLRTPYDPTQTAPRSPVNRRSQPTALLRLPGSYPQLTISERHITINNVVTPVPPDANSDGNSGPGIFNNVNSTSDSL